MENIKKTSEDDIKILLEDESITNEHNMIKPIIVTILEHYKGCDRSC